ncbi:MAG: beta-galactosidase trimerization domain-containing protein, partial [bacterium]|nr:beta-galactosidase trimerization domain-containing protein [bacterium]
LAKARVDSVTCFGRCHHGWIYYETEKFKARMHPHMSRNLLKEQIEACHKRDIRVPIYLTVQWDQYTAERYPEWLAIDAAGKQTGTPPYDAGFYRRLAVNSGYMDFLMAHVADLFDLLPVDGLFFDIVQPLDDSSYFSRKQMLEKGMNPSQVADRQKFGLEVINAFKSDMSAFIRSRDKACTIFYNAGHIGPRQRSVASAYSHFELESLPSGGWGYVHFPMAVRYARGLGLDCMGMTGKFHTSWGDFHSFKNPEALQFECFQMLAHGAKCSVGDQLLPHGEICQTTYNLIGSVYSEVEKKEPWCVDAVPQVDIALMSTEEFTGERIPIPVAGAVRLLQEAGQQFDIVDTRSDLGPYKVVILPDEVPVSGEFAARLQAFSAAGGSVIASFKSGLNPAGDAFALNLWGVSLKGDAPFCPDFLLPGETLSRNLPQTEHVMYLKGMEVTAQPGAEVLLQPDLGTLLFAPTYPFGGQRWISGYCEKWAERVFYASCFQPVCEERPAVGEAAGGQRPG